MTSEYNQDRQKKGGLEGELQRIGQDIRVDRTGQDMIGGWIEQDRTDPEVK